MRRRQAIRTLASGIAAAGLLLRPGLARAADGPDDDGLEVVIIGGGIAGLTAAYVLHDRKPAVLEAGKNVGGRAVGGRRGGWSYAKGTEYLGIPEGVFADMVGDLRLEPVEIPAPMDIAFRDGRFHTGSGARTKYLVDKGGLETFNRFLRTLRQVARDYESVPGHDPQGPLARLDAITARAWFNGMGLPEVYHEAYNVMARGLFGATLDEVSALAAFEEIAFDFEGADILEDMDDVRQLARHMAPSGG